MISWWRNTTSNQTVMWTWTGAPLRPAPPPARKSAPEWTVQGIGDFNGDGRDDILRNTGGAVVVWHMNGATLLGGGYVASVDPNEWSIVNIGDYNGDGRDDILWQHTSGTVFDWTTNGTRSPPQARSPSHQDKGHQSAERKGAALNVTFPPSNIRREPPLLARTTLRPVAIGPFISHMASTPASFDQRTSALPSPL